METVEALVSSGEHNEWFSHCQSRFRIIDTHYDSLGEKPLWILSGYYGGKFQLTPSQDVVPEELLFTDEHGHYNQGVQVDSFTQHPENCGGLCVEHHHCQEFTASLADSGRRI